MNTDDFEERLHRQAPREIPASWREGILSAARNSTPSAYPPHPAHHRLLATVRHFLSTARPPQRAAWGSLAAIWVGILALNISARDDSPRSHSSRPYTSVSPDTLQALKEQQLLLAELVGRPEPRKVEHRKPAAPGPRSQRREDSVNV